MGCNFSASPDTNKITNNRKVNHKNPNESVSPAIMEQNMNNVFFSIMKNVQNLPLIQNMMPIVCMSQKSVVCETYELQMDESSALSIIFPIIAISLEKNRKVMCISQLDLFTAKFIKEKDTSRLIINIINWANNFQSSMSRTSVAFFDVEIAKQIRRSMRDIGITVDIVIPSQPALLYSCMIISSKTNVKDPDTSQFLHEFLAKGGTLIVLYEHSESFEIPMPMNSFLLEYGLAFSYCILNESSSSTNQPIVPKAFSEVSDMNFISLSNRLKNWLESRDIMTADLDNLVTTLRYYIMVSDIQIEEELLDLYEKTWNYAHQIKPKADSNPEYNHGIIAILIQEISQKLPTKFIKISPHHSIFPGSTGNVVLGNHKIDIVFAPDIWQSTGLWLPAGAEGKIQFEGDYIGGLSVQIGSHQLTMMPKEINNRWPSVITIFPITNKEISVGTSFGGIVYITCTGQSFGKTKLIFSGFCRHPRWIFGQENVWEETRNNEVPWGEIQTETCVFTVPTDYIRKIENFSLVNDNFKFITTKISKFMNFAQEFQYRIVFDQENTESPMTGGYPLSFLIESMDSVLNSWEKPSLELFHLVSSMTIMSLRENCFDYITEAAISAVGAADVLQNLCPGFNPLEFEESSRSLFPELWEIHTNYGSYVLPQTIAIFQHPDFQISAVPEDMWISFVREMCRVAKTDFTKLLEKFKPIPLNISISLQGLPQYFPK